MDKEYLKQKIQEQKIRSLQQTNKNVYPSNFQMAKNLGSDIIKNVTSVVQGNPLSVSDNTINNRKNVCNSCEFFDKGRDRCVKCGCNLAIKTYLKASSCPIGKW